MVQTLPIGDVQLPVPGFGAMGLSQYMGTPLSTEEAQPVLQKAVDLGCTHWDTAVGKGGVPVSSKTLIGFRSLTEPAKMRNFWVTSFESTTFATRSFVSSYSYRICCRI